MEPLVEDDFRTPQADTKQGAARRDTSAAGPASSPEGQSSSSLDFGELPPDDPVVAWARLAHHAAGLARGGQALTAVLSRIHPPASRPITAADVEAADRLVGLFEEGQAFDVQRLGALHAVYAKYIPKEIQESDPQRTAETLKAALELDISPETLKRALDMAWTRDLICQVAASTIGYILSWFNGAQLSMRAVRDDWPDSLRRLVVSLDIAMGLKVAANFLRVSGMGGGWTRPVAIAPDGKAVAPLETRQGQYRTSSVYAPFTPGMLASRYLSEEPAAAPSREVAVQRSLARQDMRANLNFVSTLGVALMRYFYAAPARDYWWLDAVDKPGDQVGFRRSVMAGAVRELTDPVATARAALEYICVRPLIPLYEALAIPDAVHALRTRFPDRFGAPDDDRVRRGALSAEERNESRMIALKTLGLVVGAVLLYQMIDKVAGDFSNEPWLAPFNDVAVLLPLWGLVLTQQDRETARSPAVRAGNDYRATQWHRDLAARAPRPSEVAPAGANPV
ncbi:hypothetical protein [Ramlibacter rhizophilus]|uniref:Uncharacterized protein n=1 Tax=Ramlibacter rhizophilus TaxID=1781167 RepID=A0A4Z0BII1_9BURK|nr:hypothetical protein [Ramlibacter rhizophilus]TFY97944.1 hypothetical protein EZ242_15955 [Ramlibacter rhizophilus]